MTRKKTAGQRLIASASEALAWVESKSDGCIVHIPDEISVIRIRKKLGMSQREFADHYGFSFRTIQQWEQGRAVPSGATRAYLIVIDREPEAVHRALLDFSMSESISSRGRTSIPGIQ